MDGGPAGSIMLLIILIIGGAYFAGSETSFASVNRIHMMSGASKGSKRDEKVLYVLDHFEEALSVLLIGNNIMSIGCATLSTVIATRVWGTYAVTASTVITTIVLFLFSEMIPKCFARSCNERFAETVAGSLIVLMKLLKPLSAMFTALSEFVIRPFRKKAPAEVTMTEDELHDIVDNISDKDGIDAGTGRLVKSALDFSNATVRDILVPWPEVLKISSSMKTAQILDLIRGTGHSRIPVIDRRGNVRGILQIRKFLRAYIRGNHTVILSAVTDPPFFADADVPLDDLLTDMSNHRRNLAVIRDKEQNILGVVTVEDILEQLVGEIYDEDDLGGDSRE